MQDLVDRLRTRFPLLARASLHQQGTGDAIEALPPFLGLFMAAMAAPATTPLCFILPRRGDIARLATVLHALQRFVATQGERIRQYGETSFTTGELVRVHPSKHVFRFLGFDSRNPDFVCLRSPSGDKSERWSVRAAEFIPRLERTTLTRPIGRLSTKIHDPDPSPLDQLLGTSTFGNQGLFVNEVVLLDSSTGFDHFVESTSLQPRGTDVGYPQLKKVVPFGELSAPRGAQGGWFLKWDDRNPTGEPLIAVTSSAETVAAYCIDASPRSKLVVVNGLSRIRDLQSYDDIQQTQHLVLFADEEDDELIRALHDRGCRFWELSRDEIEAGQDQAPRFHGPVARVRIWARNKDGLLLDSVTCESSALEDACLRLESLRKLVDDEHGPATKLVARMWGLLNEAAGRVNVLSSEDRAQRLSHLQELRRELQANRAWLPREAEGALAEAASALETLLTTAADPGSIKGAALEKVVRECVDQGAASVVLVRSPRQALDIDKHFRSQIKAGQIQVCTPGGLKGDRTFDRIVCPSWPTGETLESLTSKLMAPRITVLGYAFERRWLHQFKERRLNRPRRQQIGSAQKSAIVDGRSFDELLPSDEPAPETAGPAPAADDGIWTFEQRLRAVRKGVASRPTEAIETLPARYVGFVGATYSFLTETHKMVVVTALVSAAGRTNQRLPEQTVATLKPGDFIVFPESGDRDLIQEQADHLLGSEAPTLRGTVRLWKKALWSSGMTPSQFLREARELGRPRHIMTIRNWFADTSQIGPGAGNEDLSEDLELIALVTDFAPLKEQLPQAIEAAKRLRSAHLSAGVRLRDVLIQRLPAAIGSLEEEGTMVDLGELGSAWIVQVESVAAEAEPRGRGEVNRLFWESNGVGVGGFDAAF